MISKAEALTRILARVAERRRDLVPLIQAAGRVLAADVTADHDIPPFDKSSMDGWAVRAADVAAAPTKQRVAGAKHAGGTEIDGTLAVGSAIKIMTGAPLPAGADAVVIVEDSATSADGKATTLTRAARAGQNICRRGEDARRGDVLVPAGAVLDVVALALTATAGVDPVPTWAPPRICIIPTGDELVAPEGPAPTGAQIRESNGTLLDAQVRAVSPALTAFRPGIARDTRASLDAFLDVGLAHDVLILSGGVSMGDRDLVGVALKARGLDVAVEKVSIRPGKPLLFGTLRTADGHTCHVFGLPGNPVSSFVTFELFVRPFLLRWLGVVDAVPALMPARLVHDRPLRAIARTQHLPAVLRAGADGLTVSPVAWNGSADLRAVQLANALLVVDAADAGAATAVGPGDMVGVHPLPWRPILFAGSAS